MGTLGQNGTRNRFLWEWELELGQDVVGHQGKDCYFGFIYLFQ